MNVARFWDNVRTGAASECWEWKRSRLPKGYGLVRLSQPRRRGYAHRIAWELENGPIPEGLHVLHSCDNPPCCNPAHLRVGTNVDNIRDKVIRGRTSRLHGERCGMAKLTNADVQLIRLAAETLPVSIEQLATAWSVSRMQVGRILRRVQWRHI